MERLIQEAGEKALPVKIGLVFSGGGGKDVYHVSVRKALKEYDLHLLP